MKYLKIIFLIVLTLIITNDVSAEKKFKTGTPAPNISVYKWINKEPDIKSFKGKTIILEFWATWCRPCLKTIPHLNKLVDKFASDTVLFVSITKENPKKVKKFLEKIEIKAFVGIDFNGNSNKNYKISTIPQSYVIDSNGLIIWEGHPAILNDKILEFIINKKHYKAQNESEK